MTASTSGTSASTSGTSGFGGSPAPAAPPVNPHETAMDYAIQFAATKARHQALIAIPTIGELITDASEIYDFITQK